MEKRHQFWVWNDETGTGQYLEGVVRIGNYSFRGHQWGMTRRSQRIRGQQSSKQTPAVAPGPKRTSPKRTASRASPYPTPPPKTEKKQSSADNRITLPEQALELIRVPASGEGSRLRCLNCRKGAGNASCSVDCYTDFFQQHLYNIEHGLLEIRAAGAMGYGVFVKPGVTIKKGTYLGIYGGEVQHKDDSEAQASYYGYTLLSGVDVTVNSATHGNYTRFFNSHCRPNVDSQTEQIGKTLFVVFKANRTIHQGEQVFIFYGTAYFSGGIDCTCSAQPHPHIPSDMAG